jgi:hypothetical protein
MTEHLGDDLMDDVRLAIGTLTAPWTLEQLSAASGTDVETLEPCVQKMIEGGTVFELGPDPRSETPDAMLYGPRPFEDRPN